MLQNAYKMLKKVVRRGAVSLAVCQCPSFPAAIFLLALHVFRFLFDILRAGLLIILAFYLSDDFFL